MTQFEIKIFYAATAADAIFGMTKNAADEIFKNCFSEATRIEFCETALFILHWLFD